MEQQRQYRLPILVCILLVAAALAAGLLVSRGAGSGTAEQHLSLGQRYLNELNYSGAILEFSNAIRLDPRSKDARVGLAQAYAATGSYDFAADVLEDVQDPNRPDEELAAALVEIYRQGKNYGKAIRLVDELIGLTDDPQYETLREELMRAWYAGSRGWAAGTDQELVIRGGSVMSRGRNTLGQLGTAAGLGDPDHEQTDFLAAAFPGTARSVYCAGRTSYVLDASGDLWACGENRWGQMGGSYAATLPESGWIRLTDSGDVVSLAGTAGRVLVLKLDGTLWEAGAGTGQTLKRVMSFGRVLQISACGQQLYVLATNGRLFRSSGSDWYLVSKGVVSFCTGDDGAVWLTEDGAIGCEFGLDCPDTWSWQENGALPPDLEITAVAGDSSALLMLGADGVLYLLSDRSVTAAGETGSIIDLFCANGMILAQREDGSLLALQNGRLQPVTL